MISVIIPTQNSERQLVPTLAALVQGVTAGILNDVILADGGSTDDTAAIADAAGCTFHSGTDDLGLRLRRAAANGRGRWLLFLGPSSLLEEGWPRDVAAFLETVERRGMGERTAGTFRLAMDGYGLRPRLSETAAAMRLAVLGRPQRGQGLLISRRHYERIGGHPAGSRAESRLLGHIPRLNIKVLRARVLLPVPGQAPGS